MFKHTKVMLFDYDGTLVDTSTYHKRAFSFALYRWNAHKALALRYDEIAGQRTHDALRNLGVPEDRLDELAQVKRQKFLSLCKEKPVKLFPKAKELLEMLKTKFTLGIVTGASLKMETLEDLGIREYFDFVNTSSAKPKPDGFIDALAYCNVQPQEAVVVEDSFCGVLSAGRAQIYTVGVNNPRIRSYVDHYAISLEKLYAMLRGNSSSR